MVHKLGLGKGVGVGEPIASVFVGGKPSSLNEWEKGSEGFFLFLLEEDKGVMMDVEFCWCVLEGSTEQDSQSSHNHSMG